MTDDLKKLLAEATPGPWHHVQAFESVPAVRTIYGKVPGQRVDYVSTWPGLGTPKGHRVVIPMETVAEGHITQTATSADMALICAAVNALPELLAENARLREALKAIAGRHIPDQPMAYDVPREDYIAVQYSVLRMLARAALKDGKQ